jgi:hypothetical protein
LAPATFGNFEGKLKDWYLQVYQAILAAIQELWGSVNFQELQMIIESCRNRLRWIVEQGSNP